jgi:hypothetical protein
MSVPSSTVVTIGDCIVGEAAARLRHLGGAAHVAMGLARLGITSPLLARAGSRRNGYGPVYGSD